MPARPATRTAKKPVSKRTQPARAAAKRAPVAKVSPRKASTVKAAVKSTPVAKAPARTAKAAPPTKPRRPAVASKPAVKAKAAQPKPAVKAKVAPVSRKQKVKEMPPTKQSTAVKTRVDPELAKFRDLLLSERTRLLAELEEIESRTARTSDAERATELSSYEDHPADLASETFEREKDLAIAESVESLLNQVNTALEKVERGTYGTCDACSRPIKKARLQALPFATLCLECQDRLEG